MLIWSKTTLTYKDSYCKGQYKANRDGERTFLSWWNSVRKTQGQKVSSFFNSFEMIRWRQPEWAFNYLMRGRKGGRKKGPEEICFFFMSNEEEENGKVKGKKGLHASVLRTRHKGCKRRGPALHAGNRTRSARGSPQPRFPCGSGEMPGDAGRNKSPSPACTGDLRSRRSRRGHRRGCEVQTSGPWFALKWD